MSAIATDLYCEPCMFSKLEYVKADRFCEGCREKYCQPCLMDHSKFRVLRSHPVVSLVQSETTDNEDSGDYLEPIAKRTDNEDSGDYLEPIVKRTDNEDSGYLNVPIFETTDTEDSFVNLVQKVSVSNDIPYKVDHETASEDCSDLRWDSHYKTETENEPSTQESRSFQVQVVETDLVRCIKGIGKTDIENSIFTFTVNKQGISLSLRGIQVFYCKMTAVRRYGLGRGKFCAEVGRSCTTGEGKLKLKYQGASDIYHYVNQTSKNYQ